MNRLIIAVLISGFLIIAVGLSLQLLPISIFPCTLTNSAGETIVCSLGFIDKPQEYVAAKLTRIGDFVRILLLYLIPPAIGFLGVFRFLSPKPDIRQK
jgi:hypothetical protein